MIKKVSGVVLAIVVGYVAAWFGAAFWLRAKVDAVAADLTRRNYTIERGETRFVGFPAAVGIAVPALSVAAPAEDGGWRWQADATRITLYANAPTVPVIDLTGSHRMTGHGALLAESLVLDIVSGLARVRLGRNGSPETIVVELNDVEAGRGETARRIGVKRASLDLAVASRRAVVSARDITFAQAPPVLSSTIAELDIAADLVGPIGSGPLPAVLEAWRAGGGALEIRSFSLVWPPARGAGNGTIALDEALQPVAAATITFQGFFAIVSALAQQGHIDRSTESVAAAVLGLLAKPSATGEPELSLPLTLQDGKLQAGPVMLMRVPDVVWNATARVP